MSNWCLRSLVALIAICVIFLQGVESLQCYNCRGITNYDPNECFVPTERTILQECNENEVCEKRVTMVDRLQDVIDRGCSANCQGRLFVWTDEYQVYCCKDNKCNMATDLRISFLAVIVATIVSLLYALTLS